MGEDPRDGRDRGIGKFKHPLTGIKGCAGLVTFYGLLPPEIEPHFDKIAESKTNVLKGGFEMMKRSSGWLGHEDGVGDAIGEVPPWESAWCRWG